MKKTQIYVLSLTALPNDKHMAVSAFMAEALREYAIADTSLAIFAAAFQAAYSKENQAFLRIDRKGLTRKVNEADMARINALRVLRDSLKVFLFRTDEAQKALAESVLEVIDLYGGAGIYNQPVDARTGNITNLIEDLEEKLAEAVATLGVTADVAALKAANQQFLKAQSDRDKSDADHGKQAMADARVETDQAWRAVVDSANYTIAYGSDEDREALVPFAKYMNVEIDKYRIQNGQGVGGATSSGGSGSSGSGSDSSGSESTPVMKTATFKFIDGRSESFPVEVGTVLVAPSNTVGYKWKPTVPELMPKTNKNFSEVPIENKEVTLTFHFLEHNDETLRGIVGSELTAPLNTDGCHWEPTVPPTFPDEDMTFNEVLDEPAGGEGGPLYTIAWYDKSTPIQWYELPAGAAVPEAPEPPAGHRWAQTFTVMPARDVDIVAVAI